MHFWRFRLLSDSGRRLLSVLALLTSCLLLAGLAEGRETKAADARDVTTLTARIDDLIAAKWTAEGLQPAALAGDAEFLRRVYLDLAGRIPSVATARAFLVDPSPDKRQRLVEELLAGPTYVNHFTNVWRSLLLPDNNGNIQLRLIAGSFEAWIRKQLREEVSYDRMVRELLTATAAANRGAQPARPFNPNAEPSPLAFYQANENKPENLAAATSRLFLGVKLECAQCHNHPFDRWTRTQFWQYAAFFATAPQPGVRPGSDVARPAAVAREVREIKIPGTEEVAQARYLDDAVPQWKEGVSPRATLADWMIKPENPFFARAAVNRLWAHFFGIGLVDPIDDLSDANPPSHPELLDELARQFAAHAYDVKFLIRAITASRAYQLTSATHTNESQRADVDDPRLFARMAVKGLSPEQIFDSLAEATGFRETTPVNQRQAFLGPAGARGEFLAKFANHSDKRTEMQTSILQALTLMNGRVVADATHLERSETLAAVLDAPFLDTIQQLETLYLAALTRKPRPDEAAKLLKYVEAGGPGNDRRRALADVYWAVLNSSEFILNH